MSVIVLLTALILALASGYFFLQWKCPSKQEKLQEIVEKNELEEEFKTFTGLELSELADLSPQQIKEFKTKFGEGMKTVKELQKKKTDELSEEEQKSLNSLPALQEVQGLVSEVEKKEDLGKKVYGMWDYAYAGGIALGIFLIIYYSFGKVKGLLKGEVEK
jgi:hypothetical protein